MQQLLFPNWILFAGVFLFLKIFNPTRLYIDNTSCLAIAIAMAICLEGFNLVAEPTLLWLVGVVIFAFYCSIPYWLSGMVGGVIQQMLLLNEQSVQDHRFTEESEALAKLTSLIFSFYALESGLIFFPLLQVIQNQVTEFNEFSIDGFFKMLVDNLQMALIVSGKYIILMLVITICCGYLDLFFKKASLSMFVTPNIKSIVVIIIINLWVLHDQFYLFEQMMWKLGYE
ncbi:type III secretion system apparatus protein VscT2 [Vibrio parahaemolyticus]|uniref:hypothetical protein n=1 Tax=Vibrio parahaemolyticus TaxID=670 RepID=UPI0007A0AACF|nr:hypothetical protein [Vibrio parahaemolyticus]EJG0413081.1 type III secretion system apparatus protein VscT2 [Vibrio parahaemolyticus]KYY27761.1 type III secretion system apparatus protein VscT2 [Vibrio parahaemolyticus]